MVYDEFDLMAAEIEMIQLPLFLTQLGISAEDHAGAAHAGEAVGPDGGDAAGPALGEVVRAGGTALS
jgi:hypothetical protein